MAVKAFIVGVSEYYLKGAANLPFCKNDIDEIEKALNLGMNIESKDINTIGKSGVVTITEFIDDLLKVSQDIFEEDTFLFYFSGHGTTIENKHYLVFSDKILSTNEIIGYFEKMKCKSKVIFLDACQSGNFSVSGSSKFNVEQTINDFVSKGYAVLSSSNAQQYSYGHPTKPISTFTYFLCSVLYEKSIIRQGKKSLYDIQKLVKLYLEIWNLKNPDRKQEPIFRANMGGTIYFKVNDYTPYCPNKIYEETDKYIIYKVNPVHSIVKRYSVNVILKQPFSIREIAEISLEIKEKIKNVEVYQNEKAENYFAGRDANIIWIFFGMDEDDMINTRFICRTTWVDDNQDKNYWYKVNNKTNFIINGIHYEIFSYYETLRRFEQEHTQTADVIISQIKKIASELITDAEIFISEYNEYRNGECSEEEFVVRTKDLRERITKCYLESTDIDFPPKELHEWNNACMGLFGSINDLTVFYNEHSMKQRDEKNRRDCIDMTIKRYYEDLEKVKSLESKVAMQ